uniref:Uncharacterized protein n=1 Tax=Rhizophora mucronata TaxID=61149 RepID=A0A2P2IYV6_RHIMU
MNYLMANREEEGNVCHLTERRLSTLLANLVTRDWLANLIVQPMNIVVLDLSQGLLQYVQHLCGPPVLLLGILL